MSLVGNLKELQEKVIDEKVLEFAEEMEYVIIESATIGYSGYRYQIHKENPDKHILHSKPFTEKLQELMDGVKVEFKVEEKKNILGGSYYEHYIRFSWNDYFLNKNAILNKRTASEI
ncbi:hypothetical protein COJ37_30355 [Bacillus cereus]|uniref:hypothetical protein n=2 Tax=Bacillaceae TaxID=186817 RepID=UPI000BF7457F|nr:hypothetical protein [Bacillus cereus]PEY60895.1 hypothetical protein CN356_22495 [Bacillus cereus]PFL88269.1 hypothetical protein COJ37_30355 [Bacillus cereus]PFT72190.1 hypothetical protein COK73_04620 [Bacillus cereus]PGU53305.1 hypothetical protein COD72_18530 [Bacillus cereus]